jgi:hypothetical protein
MIESASFKRRELKEMFEKRLDLRGTRAEKRT